MGPINSQENKNNKILNIIKRFWNTGGRKKCVKKSIFNKKNQKL